MSESHLPDDPASWPRDPFELLGVKQGVDRSALKRAYSRLVRLYKPEHHPEKFRRLRDAYEQLQRLMAFHQWEAASEESTEDVSQSPQAAADASSLDAVQLRLDANSSDERGSSERVSGGLEDRVDAAWERACQGDPFAAYRQLRELQATHSQRDETYPRLFWLLKLHPEVDATAAANDWLAAGLRLNAGAGTLWELYRRELAEDPREAQTPRCGELLESLQPAARFAEMAEARWQAAAQLADWELVRRDLESCWERFGLDDREVWLRLQISAVNLLAWSADERAVRLMQVCSQQIEKFDGLKGSQFDELARIDFLSDLAAGWRSLSRQHSPPRELLEIVRLSWGRSTWELRPRLLKWREEMLRNPTGFLLLLDRVTGAAPAVAVQFQRCLEFLDREDEEDEIAGQGRRVLIADFLISSPPTWKRREQYRPQVLQFCLTEFIQPTEIAYVLATSYGAAQLETEAAAAIQNDLALRCACLAHRVFWQQC